MTAVLDALEVVHGEAAVVAGLGDDTQELAGVVVAEEVVLNRLLSFWCGFKGGRIVQQISLDKVPRKIVGVRERVPHLAVGGRVVWVEQALVLGNFDAFLLAWLQLGTVRWGLLVWLWHLAEFVMAHGIPALTLTGRAGADCVQFAVLIEAVAATGFSAEHIAVVISQAEKEGAVGGLAFGLVLEADVHGCQLHLTTPVHIVDERLHVHLCVPPVIAVFDGMRVGHIERVVVRVSQVAVEFRLGWHLGVVAWFALWLFVFVVIMVVLFVYNTQMRILCLLIRVGLC